MHKNEREIDTIFCVWCENNIEMDNISHALDGTQYRAELRYTIQLFEYHILHCVHELINFTM